MSKKVSKYFKHIKLLFTCFGIVIHTSLQYMQDAPELHTKLGYSL